MNNYIVKKIGHLTNKTHFMELTPDGQIVWQEKQSNATKVTDLDAAHFSVAFNSYCGSNVSFEPVLVEKGFVIQRSDGYFLSKVDEFGLIDWECDASNATQFTDKDKAFTVIHALEFLFDDGNYTLESI